MLRSTGLVALTGINAAVSQNQYTASVALNFGTHLSRGGVIRMIRVLAKEAGSGAIIKTVGDILFFNADPAIVTADTAITAAEWSTVVGQATFAASAYGSGDANGAAAQITTEIAVSPPLDAAGRLWVAIFKTDAAAVNDAAGDDETIDIEVIYQDSL